MEEGNHMLIKQRIKLILIISDVWLSLSMVFSGCCMKYYVIKCVLLSTICHLSKSFQLFMQFLKQCTERKLLTCCKSLTNIITQCGIEYQRKLLTVLFYWSIHYSKRFANGYELCPSSSRFILILIWVGVSSKACKR
jgi:hypothetical protein